MTTVQAGRACRDAEKVGGFLDWGGGSSRWKESCLAITVRSWSGTDCRGGGRGVGGLGGLCGLGLTLSGEEGVVLVGFTGVWDCGACGAANAVIGRGGKSFAGGGSGRPLLLFLVTVSRVLLLLLL